jgi:hypothetical protein
VSTDDVVFRVQPAAVDFVAAPLRHEFTLSAAVSVLGL